MHTTARHQPSSAARVEDVLLMLHKACEERNILVTADHRVSEADATNLVGYAPGSLKNLRALGGAPAYYRRGAGGGRISYRLEDLASWLEAGREDW